jgi:hypothetical protein
VLVDYDLRGVPIGVEILATGRHFELKHVNSVLEQIGVDPLAPEESQPLLRFE